MNYEKMQKDSNKEDKRTVKTMRELGELMKARSSGPMMVKRDKRSSRKMER
jgi:hypothetical protein